MGITKYVSASAKDATALPSLPSNAPNDISIATIMKESHPECHLSYRLMKRVKQRRAVGAVIRAPSQGVRVRAQGGMSTPVRGIVASDMH